MSKKRSPRPETQRVAVFQDEFREDLGYWVEVDRRMELVEAVMRDPFRGIGKPEHLRSLPRVDASS